MNVSQRNNNPLNLKDRNQAEEVDLDQEGFARFTTPIAGWRAAHRQIALDQGRGLSLEEFIHKFAPPRENDSENYLKFVCAELRVPRIENLRDISKYALAGVMAQMEGYYSNE